MGLAVWNLLRSKHALKINRLNENGARKEMQATSCKPQAASQIAYLMIYRFQIEQPCSAQRASPYKKSPSILRGFVLFSACSLRLVACSYLIYIFTNLTTTVLPFPL